MATTVLIIGAASDMAAAIAQKFAAAGYDIQLAARRTERLQPLQSDLQIRHRIICTMHELDIIQFDKHQSFWNSLQVKPDITISVVGYMNDNDKVIASGEETIKTIATNYTGPVSLLNIIAADYASRQQGVIVGISSVAGMRGRQSNYIYGSAKAGFTAYLSGLRNKLFHSKVHVMTVLPGFVYTKMTEHLNLPKLLTAQPADVANAVYKGVKKKKNRIFVKWFWRWIMLIITSIPESMFKKKKL
jgi:decaprenylphospho-beta-D-erythro-pentofuranosid-2-ulose 2-reductase